MMFIHLQDRVIFLKSNNADISICAFKGKFVIVIIILSIQAAKRSRFSVYGQVERLWKPKTLSKS